MRALLMLIRLVKQVVPCLITFVLGYNLSQLLAVSDQPPHPPSKSPILHAISPHSTIQLLIVIISNPANVQERRTIRSTWLDVAGPIKKRTKSYFVIGTNNLESKVSRELDLEQSAHNDLLLLPIEDSYKKLTNKVLETFIYVNASVKFNYLLKCDDDTFVDLATLVKELENQPYNPQLYWGFFDGRAPVFTTGKWAEPQYKLCDKYLPYALGGGYIVAHGLVEYIANNAHLLLQYNSEDASVGAWLAPVKVDRKHDVRFDTEWKSRGCQNKFVVTHKQSPGEMKLKWKRLQRSGLICDGVETKVRLSYNYDWSKPPSQCCVREDHSLP